MRYRTLGNSGCAVSELCLGTMTFGDGDRRGRARTPSSTGSSRPAAPSSTRPTSTRRRLGGDHRPLARRPSRGRDRPVVLATKGRFPIEPVPNAGGLVARGTSPARSTPRSPGSGSTASTSTRCTPGTRWTPLEETLRTLDGFVRAGKIRYYGFSNFTGWQLTKAVHIARAARAGRAGHAAAAVQPDRARDRVGDRPRGARRRAGPAALEPARWRLAHRQVPARPATHRQHPARRGPRARHGGVGAARHRAHLGHHRGRPAGRRGPRRLDGRRWPWPGSPTGPASPRRSSAPARWSSSRTTSRRVDVQLDAEEVAALDEASDLRASDYPYGELALDQRSRDLATG